jgi:hypothetical protein
VAENPPQETTTPKATKEPYGPGLMALFGLALLVVAAFCGRDYFWPSKEWEEAPWKVWFNGGAMAAGVAGAIYCFVAAVVRSKKKGGADPKDSASSDK